jgi:hypothetical protein
VTRAEADDAAARHSQLPGLYDQRGQRG